MDKPLLAFLIEDQIWDKTFIYLLSTCFTDYFLLSSGIFFLAK